MNISVIGLGKAGLPLAAVIADAGIHITGIDIDGNRIEQLKNKINPIPEEPGLQEIIEKTIGRNWDITSDFESGMLPCTTHIVIVPLFIDEKHLPDFTLLDNAFSTIGRYVKKGDLIILETTVPPGTTETRVVNILEAASGKKAGRDFLLAYSPERIMTGYSISRYRYFPKVVGGINDASAERAFQTYSLFCHQVNKVRDTKTAEMVKVAEGVYRDVNIALANELYKVCRQYDINYWEVRRMANHQFCDLHEPGSVGGHCIPVYPWFLIHQTDVPLIKTARSINDDMIYYYFQQVKKISEGGNVGIVGLSYRRGVKSSAYSAACPFIKLLKKNGYTVYGIDPLYEAEEIRAEFNVTPLHAFEEMDVIILLNAISDYNEVLNGMKDRVIDVKNILGTA